MANVARGGSFNATFKAAATLATLYQPVYISAADTVAAVNTVTNIAVGVVAQKSKGGANTSVDINLFTPTRIAWAGGAVTAGLRVAFTTGTSLLVNAATGTGAPCGVAVTTAATASETVEYIPFLPYMAAIV